MYNPMISYRRHSRRHAGGHGHRTFSQSPLPAYLCGITFVTLVTFAISTDGDGRGSYRPLPSWGVSPLRRVVPEAKVADDLAEDLLVSIVG